MGPIIASIVRYAIVGVLIWTGFVYSGVEQVTAQEGEVTPEQLDAALSPDDPQPVRSLFDDDTCAPPCWFGLKAGVSTSDDAYQMFSSNEALFWTDLIETGRTEDGSRILSTTLDLGPLLNEKRFSFFWGSGFQYSSFVIPGNHITLVEHRITSMAIHANRDITLPEALERMGEPDTVRAGRFFYYDFLLLYYRSPRVIVQMTTDIDSCDMSSFHDDFQVEYVYYLTADTYRERAVANLETSYYVSPPTWGLWNSDTLSGNCGDTIALLRIG